MGYAERAMGGRAGDQIKSASFVGVLQDTCDVRSGLDQKAICVTALWRHV
jgi:hypothetical protein